MAINLKVNVSVVDLRTDSPQSTDQFMVDTNVWYWLSYTKASSVRAKAWQVKNYPEYIKQARSAGAHLFSTGFNFSELASVIEKSEYELFKRKFPGTPRKEFRHNYPVERANVVAEISAAWTVADSSATFLEMNVDNQLVANALHLLPSINVDGYDLFIVLAMQHHKITQIITDDTDFASVPGITVFTSSNTIIEAATTVGKLVTR